LVCTAFGFVALAFVCTAFGFAALAFVCTAFGFADLAFFAAFFGAAAAFARFLGSSFDATFRAVRATALPARLTADFPCVRGICLPFALR
jgi:hypothetical protein